MTADKERMIAKALKTKKGLQAFVDALMRPILNKRALKSYTDWLKPQKQRKFKV